MTAEETLAFMRSAQGLSAAREVLSLVLRMDAAIALDHARLDALRKKRGSAQQQEALQAGEGRVLSAYRALTQARRGIEAVIGRVPGEACRAVLTRRYLEGQPFFRIAMDLNYDERQIYRIHRRGLQHVAAQLAQGLIPEKNPS